MKDISGLRQHFESMCEKYSRNNTFSQVYIKFIFSNLLKDFYENLPSGKEQKLDQEIEELYCSTDFQTVMEIINRNIDRLEKEFASHPQIIHKEIESVKKYIKDNTIGKVTLIDTRYITPQSVGNFVTFDSQDVIFIYGAGIVNNSSSLR